MAPAVVAANRRQPVEPGAGLARKAGMAGFDDQLAMPFILGPVGQPQQGVQVREPGPGTLARQCRFVDAGRLPTQHLSDGSYFAITNPALHKGRRHAVCVQCGRGCRAQIECNNQIEDDVDGGSSLAL